jgi:hypothetical protein
MRHDLALLPRNPKQAEEEPRQADSTRKRRGKLLSGLYGMLAEILFGLGLVSIGFLISLFVGW